MELRVLKYFLAVAHEQSIIHAAEALHLTQPTLSTQLKALEQELGKQLLIRGSKGSRKVTLTQDGMILKKRAEEILQLVDKTEQEIRSSEDVIIGDLYIGAGETEGVKLIARTAKCMMNSHPGIHFHLRSGNAEYVSEQMDKGLLDFGLIFGDVDHRKYNSIRFPHEDIWGIIARRDDPIAKKDHIEPDDLKDLPLLVSSEYSQNAIKEWMNTGEEEPLHIVSTYNLLNNAALMVEEGVGYAVTLNKIIYTGPDSNLIFLPFYPENKAPLHLIWKKYQILSRPAECFLNHIQALAESSASQN